MLAPVRVLAVGNMYPPHHLGGYELVWRAAVRHLRRLGQEVRVLTTDYRASGPDPSMPEDEDVHRELRWYWRDHAFPRLTLSQRLALERHNAEMLERHIRELSPEVVSWWAMGGMSMSLIESVRRAGMPAVGFVHDDWLVYGPRVDGWHRALGRLGPLGFPVGWLTRTPPRMDLNRAAKWVFVSEATRQRAKAAGFELDDSAIAHSGIDPALFPAAPEKPWSGRLLCVGRIDRRKGLETGIRAIGLQANATLTILGKGDEEHLLELRALVRDLGLDRRVTFGHLGRERLAEAYAEADAVVFPVLWEEPWGLVPLEAMSVGAPVIATGAGGSGEYLRDGENCLIFAPRDDPAALARAVERLAADGELRRRLREGGFRTVPRYTERAFNEAVAGALAEAVRR
jgi:glycogen(starch) synthase